MSLWNPVSSDLIFSKKDPQDPRLGDCFLKDDSKTPDLVIWGYPDDEGIRLNGARPGAALAPSEIRRVFYKMTPDPRISLTPKIFDHGDLSCEPTLADRHSEGSKRAQAATDQKIPWASFGGGHDYGYADGSGFLRSHLAKSGHRPLIVNFDAHLDVRSSAQNLNSGTPFFRLLQEFSGQFEFVEIGLQPQCNSAFHWNWAKSQGAQLVSLDQVEEQGLLRVLQQTLSPFLGHPLWLSLDMDAMTSSEAPGCSQSWTTGLRAQDLLSSFQWLVENFSWKAFSIYEVSPPLDFDNRTSKLAALFLHRYLHCQLAGVHP